MKFAITDAMKEYLFSKKILVGASEIARDPEVLPIDIEIFSCILTEWNILVTDGIHLLALSTISDVARLIPRSIPDSFYRNFPDSIGEINNRAAIVANQILHYAGLIDHAIEEVVERRKLHEYVGEPDRYAVVSPEKAWSIIETDAKMLAATSRPLSDSNFEFLMEVEKAFADQDEPAFDKYSKNTAIKLLVRSGQLPDYGYLNHLEIYDVPAIVEDILSVKYPGMKINKLNLKNQDRKFITRCIDILVDSADSEDFEMCLSKRAIWKGILHHIHYASHQAYNKNILTAYNIYNEDTQSVESQFVTLAESGFVLEAAKCLVRSKGPNALLRNLDYLISRINVNNDAGFYALMNYLGNEIGEKRFSGIVLLQQLYRVSYIHEKNETRSFNFIKNNQFITHRETDDEMSRRKTGRIPAKWLKALTEQLGNLVSEHYYGALDCKVYVSPTLNGITLPIQEGAASGGSNVLPKGSTIKMSGDTLRLFTYWEKVDDIDLSAITVDADFNYIHEYSWRTFRTGRNQWRGLAHSGDETRGYNGGTEYLDIRVNEFRQAHPETRYLILCNNVYSSTTFDHCICRAGYMVRKDPKAGEAWEPKTVKTSFAITGNARAAYLYAIDILENKIIWLNVCSKNGGAIAGRATDELKSLKRYVEYARVMDMWQFFELAAKEVVPVDEAEIIISDDPDDWRPGVEIVRSCDTARILEIMNM